MESSKNDLDHLWSKIAQGTATGQDRVDAAALAGRSGDQRFVPPLLELLQDEDAQVRFYALQSLVIDLQQTDQRMYDHCIDLLRRDIDEHVRSMAATCLGKISFGTREPRIFQQLLDELKSPNQPLLAKSALYVSLFKVAGRPPIEWSGLLGSAQVLEEQEIDWEKVAWLEDQMDDAT